MADEIRRRKVTDYLVHVRISAFPYMKEEDQKKFAEDLMQMGDIFIEEEEIDTKESLNVLRSLMSKGRGFQVK